MSNKKSICKADLRNVAEDIIKCDITHSDSLEDIMNKFYDIMRKHGVKKGTRKGSGVSMNNYEWTICKELLFSRIYSILEVGDVMYVPDDLEVY